MSKPRKDKTVCITYDLVSPDTNAVFVAEHEMIVTIRKSITIHSGMVKRLVEAVEKPYTETKVGTISWVML